jgi:hypothetical protein
MSNTELGVPLFPLKYAIACIEIDLFCFLIRRFFRLFWGEKVPVGAIDLPVVGQKAK